MRYKFSNSLTNAGMLLWGIIIGFIMAPILLGRMQAYQYGVWEIVVAIVGYSGILDLGVKLAVTRFVSLYNKTDIGKLNVLMSTAFIFLTCLGLGFGLICIILGNLNLFTSQFEQVNSATIRLCLILIAAQIFFAFPRYTIESYFQGCHRYALVNVINLLSGLFSVLVIVLFMTNINALIILPAINALVNMVVFIYLWIKITYIEKPAVLISRRYFDYEELRTLIAFGSKTFVQGIASKFHSTVGLLITGWFFGPATVPVYSFSAQLLSYLVSLGSSIAQPLLPYFTQLGLENSSSRLKNQYTQFSAAIIQLMMVAYLGVIFYGQTFLTLWIGEEIGSKTGWIILTLAIGEIINAPVMLSNWVLTSMNRHGFLAKMEVIRAFIRLIFALALLVPFDLLGVAMGIALGRILIAPAILIYLARQLETEPGYLLWQSIKKCLCPSIVMFISYYLLKEHMVVKTWLDFIIAVSITGATYVLFSIPSLAKFYTSQIKIPS